MLADQFHLSDNERTQLLPSGKQSVFTNRIAWAKSHLKQAGLFESPGARIVRPGTSEMDARSIVTGRHPRFYPRLAIFEANAIGLAYNSAEVWP